MNQVERGLTNHNAMIIGIFTNFKRTQSTTHKRVT